MPTKNLVLNAPLSSRVSFTLGVITSFFTIFYGIAVFSKYIQYSQHGYYGIIAGFMMVLSISGLILAILGLRTYSEKIGIFGIVLCFLVFFSLVFIDLNFFPVDISFPYFSPF